MHAFLVNLIGFYNLLSSYVSLILDAFESNDDRQNLLQNTQTKSRTLPGFVNPNIAFEEFEKEEANDLDSQKSTRDFNGDDQK